MSLNIELARHNMIEQQVRPWDVLDSRVLEVFSAIRREDFVPAAQRNLAFADVDLPLGHGEVMLRPVIEGRLLQAALPTKEESVLEVGTGSGFFTACLARLAGRVTSLDVNADFIEAATLRLHAANVRNVTLENIDAVRDFKASEAYDVMVVTGAAYDLPPQWRGFVRPNGRIIALIGESPAQRAMLFSRGVDTWSELSLFETDLPYLRHAEPPARFSL
ncbi:MAG TPA: protein-L-isoaspartate O-methyltransferase [Rudaea sp.]|jgi:protein-L-isoaspartate(D-aspartate) O-methyltransferase|nr:protein-L-isoaspartate O-methyltransferase [Rudaea sp.]